MKIIRQNKIKTEFGNASIGNGYYKITSTKEGNYNKLLHRCIFEKYFGKIPEGFVVHHKDGDKLNNCIFNLQLMRENDHRKLHNKGNKHCLGRIVSEETRAKQSKSMKGKSLSEEHKAKLSEAKKGNNHPQAKYTLWPIDKVHYDKNRKAGNKAFVLKWNGKFVRIGMFHDWLSVECIYDLIGG